MLYSLEVEDSWYWGEEIIFCRERGLIESIHITEKIAYIGKPVFRNFVNTLYDVRYE